MTDAMIASWRLPNFTKLVARRTPELLVWPEGLCSQETNQDFYLSFRHFRGIIQRRDVEFFVPLEALMRCCGGFLTLMMGCVLILGAAVQPSLALVYTGGLGHTTAPGAGPGWDSVGKMQLASGVYLGDGWVLTAYHVYQFNNAGDRYIELDQRYYEIPGTFRRIEYSPGVNADLAMFRINGNPALPLIGISDTTPLSQKVTVIAGGYSRVGEQVNFGNDYFGFETNTTRVKRWGRNLTGDDASIIEDGGFGGCAAG